MRNLADLPRSEQERLGRIFRRAIQCRRKQWAHERELEEALDGELNLDIEEWASMDGHQGDMNYLVDLYVQLGGEVPLWAVEAARRENGAQMPQM